MKVTIEYLGYIKQSLGLTQAENLEIKTNASVRDLLVQLAEKHGEPFKKSVYLPEDKDLQPHHILALNGLMVNLINGLDTKLKEGDRVTIMPVVTGG